MPQASYTQSSFVGGEWSKLAQGRYHDDHYRKALNVCLNFIPQEQESLVRRPGFQYAQTTRSGLPGRVISFAFQQQSAYTIEFTDGYLRLRSGLSLATTNDSVVVSSISTANPAVVTLASAVTWATGDQAFFTLLGTSCPLLQNRTFSLTKLTTTTFSMIDAVTGATIDGSTLGVGGLQVGATINRILAIATPYVGGIWASLRMVQTELTAFLLQATVPPQTLLVTAQPTASSFAAFSFAASVFNDGPYLDPFTNGVQAVPGSLSGIVTITLQFPAYSATTAYAKGTFVTSASVNYQSLIDQNVGNTPVSSPSAWLAVSAGAAINNGQGFLGSDIGRLVRFYSEPPLWVSGTTYAKGATVSYNPSGAPGQTTYWNSLVASNLGNVPGTDLINWQLLQQGGTSSPALWTWGKIVSLSNLISGGTGTNIGNMTGNGGLAAAFNGTTTQTASSSAALNLSNTAVVDAYVGKNYSGVGGRVIYSGTVYPSSNQGFAFHTGSSSDTDLTSIIITLRAKASLPASPSDGTVLGTTTLTADQITAVTILSNDTSTVWNYVWFEITNSYLLTFTAPSAYVAQALFFTTTGSGISSGVNVEILGSPFLYTNPIITWRLGVYSDTTGWPTCGTYSDGRLWLSGAVANRIDACVANGITLGTGAVNWAPTDQYGNVLTSSGISAVFNAPDTNPIFWMIPDLQGIICGTRAGEWLVQAPTSGPISPVNISARRVTTVGCANIEPRRTEHTTIFCQKFLRKIIEYFPDVFSGKFTAPNINSNSKHLTIGNLREIAYQQEINPVVWARTDGGDLVGWTYKRDTLMTSQGPTIAAGHRHNLGSRHLLQSITTGPSVGGNLDALTVVSLDPSTGINHVEVLGDTLDEGSMLSDADYLDNSIVPSSTTTSNSTPAPYGGLTLNGLWHLNDKTVTAWLGGLDCGDYTVSNGSITVPYGDGVAAGTANGLFTAAFVTSGITANDITMFTGSMPMWVGFTYVSDGQIVRPHAPQEAGSRSGPAFGKLRRNHYVVMQLEGSQGVSFGTDFNKLYPAQFREANGVNFTLDEQFTGIFRGNLQDQSNFDGLICWRVTRPYICNLAAAGGMLETQDV